MELAQGLIIIAIVCVALVAAKIVWEIGKFICGIRISIDYVPI